MDDKHEGCFRGFTILSESWYAKSVMGVDIADEIMIGLYYPDGGTTGEFAIRWVKLKNNVFPRLEAFRDSWSALERFDDVLGWMSDVNWNISPQEFAEVLRDLGVEDRTERVSPYSSPAEKEYASWFKNDHNR